MFRILYLTTSLFTCDSLFLRMSFWLVPPLVLLPRAIKGIPNNKVATWIKLAIVHFGLFVGSNALAAGIYKGVDYFCNGINKCVSSKDDSVGEKSEEWLTKRRMGIMRSQRSL